MTSGKLLDGLDEGQKKAVTLETNGIVAAGAGSGKTKVLASRYVWLVTEKGFGPEEILALTFTNKAVSEMYSRIYIYLLGQSAGEGAACENAARALDNFHKARIGTLDSFSAGIARTAAARYGISPDFKSDETALGELAKEAALRFVLDNREDPALRQLLVDHKIRKAADEIFARVVLNYSPVSSPLDTKRNLEAQKKKLLAVWREKVDSVNKITSDIIDALRTVRELNKSIKFSESLGEILLSARPPELPDISPLLEAGGETAKNTKWAPDFSASETRRKIKQFFDYYTALIAIRTPSNYGEVFTPLVNYFRLLKGKDGGGLCHEIESVANCAFNFALCAGLYALIEKFQAEFNVKKRETGLLSFTDIARLAVDALKDHPDIRKAYKDSVRMIMIDEFQDNNALQRDLVYLLAEKSGRMEKGVPAPGELEPDRVFFVGDEKQSIYRFRGADVAVFRSLGNDLFSGGGEEGSIDLAYNYRSRPGLIAAFNRVFSDVFLPRGNGVPVFEAEYRPVSPPEEPGAANDAPLVHFCFLNGEELPKDDAGGIKSQDLEAAFIARKIRDMVNSREKISKRKGNTVEWTECRWGDFAVLERSYTHQGALEKYFREFGIPFNTDRPSGLFNDAPVLDLRAYLRLLVYPEDRIAYAALIRSPFVRLSDLSLAVCMLNKNAEPFAEENEPLIPQSDLALYRRARERYTSLREASRGLSAAELVTRLWFDEGYRYETLWTESAQVYESLFDLFFNLAADADARGKSLAEFIEYLDDVMNREEKPDDMDIPSEGESGVRILSIHKSKGLEFPVVFIYDCAHSGNMKASSGLIRFDEKYGLILDIPQAEELPVGGSYFREAFEEEERKKNTAELRRLLYVAMTRAECGLFLTFTLPAQTSGEKKEWNAADAEFNEDTIRGRLGQLSEKEGKQATFLTLLQGIMGELPPSLCCMEVIPVLSRAEISVLARRGADGVEPEKTARGQKQTALAAAVCYENAEIIPEGKAGTAFLHASKLSCGRTVFTGAAAAGDSTLDGLLEKTGVDPAAFGTLVHAVLEARLNGRPFIVPPKIHYPASEEKSFQKLKSAAESMADSFLVSELGKRCAASKHRETEFPIITSVNIEGKSTAVTGQVDLLFEEENEVIVADFKTDRTENPEDHYGQLSAYYRAAGDIFGKRVSVWLYYVRSGRMVNATEAVAGISLEEIASGSLSRPAETGEIIRE